eukprot:9178517-Pyramimonas_sp.AAC.1
MRKWAVFVFFGFRRRGNSSSPRLGAPSKSGSERPRPSTKRKGGAALRPWAPLGRSARKGRGRPLGL